MFFIGIATKTYFITFFNERFQQLLILTTFDTILLQLINVRTHTHICIRSYIHVLLIVIYYYFLHLISVFSTSAKNKSQFSQSSSSGSPMSPSPQGLRSPFGKLLHPFHCDCNNVLCFCVIVFVFSFDMRPSSFFCEWI